MCLFVARFQRGSGVTEMIFCHHTMPAVTIKQSARATNGTGGGGGGDCGGEGGCGGVGGRVRPRPGDFTAADTAQCVRIQ